MQSHITPVRRISDQVWVTGQVRPDAMSELAAAGFSRLVNHRPDGEEPGQPTAADVRSAAVAAGLQVTEAPVSGLPSAEAVAATRAVLDSLTPEDRVLMFCRSGMRSTAAWAMAERIAGGDADQLRAAAAEAGYDLSRVPL